MPNSKNLGKIAYEGYHTTRYRNYEKDRKVPPFDEISQGEREDWADAADAVWDEAVEACIRDVQDFIDGDEGDQDDYFREAILLAVSSLRRLRTTQSDDQ